MDIATVVISALGAGGVGSLVTTYLTQGKDRRSARAEVVRAVGRCEASRWAGNPAFATFGDATRDLLAAALVAQVPYRYVAEYVASARVAAWASRDDWEESGGADEYAGGISTELSTVVSTAAAALVSVVWRPWIGQIRGRRLLAEAQRAELPAGRRAAIERARLLA